MDYRINIESGGKGEPVDSVDGCGNSLGKVGRKPAKIAENRRQTERQKQGETKNGGGDENNDGDGARGAITSNLEFGNAEDEGSQNHGKERADVNNLQLFGELPGDVEREEDADTEEDVASYRSAGLLFAGAWIEHRGGQHISPVNS